MKMIRIIPIALLVITLLANSETAIAAKWTSDFDKALTTSKETGKPILAFVYHPFSYYKPSQKRADFLVWDTAPVARMTEKFIQFQVNVEKQSKLGTQFGVIQYPAVLFFDLAGREILAMRMEDVKLTQTQLVSHMKEVLKRIEEFTLIEQRIKTGDSDPRLVLRYANGLRDRAQFALAEEQYIRLNQWKDLDPAIRKEADSANTLMIFFQASRAFYEGDYGKSIDLVKRFIAKDPNSDSIHQANFLLGMAYFESGDKQDAEKVLKSLSRNSKAGIFQEKAKFYLDQKKGSPR